MKLKSLILIASAGLILACSSETKNTTEANTIAQISIEGMTCEVGCAKGIEKELSAENGIASVDVNFEDKTALINFDKSVTSEKEIESFIEGMNDGQYEVDVTSVENKSKSSDIGSGENKDDIEASSFNFEVPNLFSAFRSVL